MPSQQDDAREGVAAPCQQPTEISVSGDEHPSRRGRLGHHLGVGRTEEPELADMDRIMAGSDEMISNPWGEAFVNQKPHAPARSGSSRSRTASAAYRSASRTSSVESWG